MNKFTLKSYQLTLAGARLWEGIRITFWNKPWQCWSQQSGYSFIKLTAQQLFQAEEMKWPEVLAMAGGDSRGWVLFCESHVQRWHLIVWHFLRLQHLPRCQAAGMSPASIFTLLFHDWHESCENRHAGLPGLSLLPAIQSISEGKENATEEGEQSRVKFDEKGTFHA